MTTVAIPQFFLFCFATAIGLTNEGRVIGGDRMTSDELSREGEDPETCQLASRHQLQGPALTRSVTPPVVFCHLCLLGRDSKRGGQVMCTVREPHGRAGFWCRGWEGRRGPQGSGFPN